MIKTIIFDIGNVLTDFAWEPFFKNFGYDDETYQRICRATVGSPVWSEYDRGLMTDEEVMEAFVQNDPGIEKELRESLADIENMLLPCDYAVPWVRELKEKGYQVLVLSNFSHKAYAQCQKALDFLNYVDGGILSFREHCIKPDPAIYGRLIEKYRLVPEECVFLDDLPQNVKAAREAGLNAFVFENYAQAVAQLKALGVN